ncbi:RluA family pseudouridine synthase [Ectobacillus panaciterrae]|uniref:RluA family pseudouridine synthase n=1 Tax=Ectobacillus panaciterrae TaxID=363872 RepID=UPI0003F9560D|nr:RluA family pseudouridine synthase [Ectobacillus panaciterrae]
MYTEKRGEWCFVIVPAAWSRKTIETILKEEWQVPKKLLHQFRMEKAVLYNGEAVRWTEAVKEGDTLQVWLFPEEVYGIEPEYIEADIVYEDDHVLIADKPYGMDTHPSEKGGKGTLANAVAFHLQTEGIHTKVRHIHRLDKDTTGGVVFAKHALAGAIMDRLLTERKIKRTYWALVEGKVKKGQGKIDEPIGRDRHHATRRRVSPKGDPAVTYYKAVRYLPKQNITLVELELETGRTHQIRVHMSHLGHPLIGDTLYGGHTSLLKRQALHAARIRLLHPITHEQIEVEIPLPADLKKFIQM